jgi:energy-coupling factor transporter ATP-binding protein EcfA2
VEGGFLNGLDLRLQPGLNVLIGARGTGKTSIIEVIRYAFGARNQTAEGAEISLKHARATLADGEVILTMEDGFDTLTLSRTATEDQPRCSGLMPLAPIIFSQKEIENVGQSEQGRLNLIDGFISDRPKLRAREEEARHAIVELDRDIGPIRAEIARLDEEITKREEIAERATILQDRQSSLRSKDVISESTQQRVQNLSDKLKSLARQRENRSELSTSAERWSTALRRTLIQEIDLTKPDQQDLDLMAQRARLQAAASQVRAAADEFDVIRESAAKGVELLRQQEVMVENAFREARAEIESAIEGAGSVEKQLHSALQEIERLDNQARLRASLVARLDSLRESRETLLDDLEDARSQRYHLRKEVSDRLNSALSPRIRVTVQRSAQFREYTMALVEALRGSGLKYSDLAATLANAVSPRELVRYVEEGDYEGLTNTTGLSLDRATRVLNALADAGTSEILVAAIDDNVRLRLLDGTEYKDITDLSAGQRCTVTLPIVFQHSDRTLVIDQPEDHIDNAFIVETLIKSLLTRGRGSQIILSTHNANIPVLGNADWVVHMVSDGREGSVAVAEPLSGFGAVEAITGVMEGGMKAFHDRATFYGEHFL